jgi:hypothetical protein
MPKTYEPIATTTLGSAQSTVTLSSIPSTYTDLIIISQPKSTATEGIVYIQFNSIGGTSYSSTYVYGSGSSASSGRRTNSGLGVIAENAYATSTAGATTFVTQVFNYANTTTFKTWLSRGNRTDSQGTEAMVGLCRDTSAINSVSFAIGGTTFAAGSVFSIYGIKAA